jgi:hypothetical protein
MGLSLPDTVATTCGGQLRAFATAGFWVPAEVEAVLRGGESLTQFIEEAVVSAAAWRRVQAEFVNRGEAAIERWKRDGGGRTVDEVMAGLQGRLDDAKRRTAQRPGK